MHVFLIAGEKASLHNARTTVRSKFTLLFDRSTVQYTLASSAPPHVGTVVRRILYFFFARCLCCLKGSRLGAGRLSIAFDSSCLDTHLRTYRQALHSHLSLFFRVRSSWSYARQKATAQSTRHLELSSMRDKPVNGLESGSIPYLILVRYSIVETFFRANVLLSPRGPETSTLLG